MLGIYNHVNPTGFSINNFEILTYGFIQNT